MPATDGTESERHNFQVVSASGAAVTATARRLGVQPARMRQVLSSAPSQLDHHDVFLVPARQLDCGGAIDTVLDTFVSAHVSYRASEADNNRTPVDMASDSSTSRDLDPLGVPADLALQAPVKPHSAQES